MTPVSFWFLVLDTHRVDSTVVEVLRATHPPQHTHTGLWSWSHMSPDGADHTAAILRAHGVPTSSCAAGVVDGLPPPGTGRATPLGADLELVWDQGRSRVRRRKASSHEQLVEDP